MSSSSMGQCAVCGKDAAVVYPLLPEEPKFCSAHHTQKDAGPFGADLSGPDDFDKPENHLLPNLERATFIWINREGDKYYLKDIDDRYLENIVRFLEQSLPNYFLPKRVYWIHVLSFLR